MSKSYMPTIYTGDAEIKEIRAAATRLEFALMPEHKDDFDFKPDAEYIAIQKSVITNALAKL